MASEWRYRGRVVTADDVTSIRQLIAEHPGASRRRLSEELCEVWQWKHHWLWPDAFSRQAPSVLKAKQAISNYKKAIGDPAGLAELMVFYCEQASGFASDLGYQDESYLNALVRMFEQTATITTTLPAGGRDALVARLERVRTAGHKCGYGVGDDMDSILAKYAKRLACPPMRK
jgi:hypothetical protein